MNHKKELVAKYRDRTITGGVYRIVNTRSGRAFMRYATDISAARNKFDFMTATGNCAFLEFQKDWSDLGPASFSFEVLEEHEKKPDQTDEEFVDDLKTLELLWREKIRPMDEY